MEAGPGSDLLLHLVGKEQRAFNGNAKPTSRVFSKAKERLLK